MGEVALSSEEKGMEVGLKTGEVRKREEDKSSNSGDIVRWEEFLPKMALRVLLVEADDSTRQIITALLQKCSYKVSAVPDGLKAWEILKERPHNIDLVLAELDSPAISGYALLTLAMEHDICRNIPVIIMSKHNSISMVLKCMLKGAADFLIKPIRKNELRNLWQHIWRRQNHTARDVSEKANNVEHKHEACSQNNKASNNSSFTVLEKKNKERTEKESDPQSACTTAYMEAESAYMQNVQGLSQFRCSSERHKNEKFVKMDSEPVMPESSREDKLSRPVSEVADCKKTRDSADFRHLENHPSARMTEKELRGMGSRGNAEVTEEGCNERVAESCSTAVNLLCRFGNCPKGAYGHSSVIDGGENLEFDPNLGLSFRRSCHSGILNHSVDEGHMLNHSDSSPFARYESRKTSSFQSSVLADNCAELEDESKSYQILPNRGESQNIGGARGTVDTSQGYMFNPFVRQSGHPELAYATHEQRMVHTQRPSVTRIITGYACVPQPVGYLQGGLPQTLDHRYVVQREQYHLARSTSINSSSEIHSSEQGLPQNNESVDGSDRSLAEEPQKFKTEGQMREDLPFGGPVVGDLCNPVSENPIKSSLHENSSEGSVQKVTAPETCDLFTDDKFKSLDAHPSSQRAAALMKFRMKRKDRCFEKKVRYESRKRMAEQRPRVKGQFVRQVKTDQ